MEHTLFSLLTNEESRRANEIQASLDHESAAGAPWFNEAVNDVPRMATPPSH